MHDSRTHPLLAQVPLTVSPFINLPTSTTLPYTYKPMPSTLPPSATGITSTTGSSSINSTSTSTSTNPATAADGTAKPQYVLSPSGHAAHPDDIIASCHALQAHVAKLQADAEKELQELDERIRARELAEKRRVAPGWLDSEARLLEPEKVVVGGGDSYGNGNGGDAADLMTGDDSGGNRSSSSGGGGVDGPMQTLSLVDGAAHHGQMSEMAAHEDEGAQMDRAFGSLPYRPA
ncbi:hypothetical protein BD289DRAFT_456985 [Coniella lustricola]|uniref:Uncharacterized protein n=1 Tax=Coniella lustricola TaxID=2025994 RepID=A0A2T2ZTP2_9PEZI|nr:hypothetical protein BD289DRAFT_456985 [Coniella lustricola]